MMRGWKTLCWLGLFFLSACAEPSTGPELENTIHYYQFSLPRDRGAFDELLGLFSQEHPEIRVKIHTLPTTSGDQHQFYLTHASSRGESRIDVFALDVIWLAEFARAGLLLAADGGDVPLAWKEFFATSVRAATYRGTRFAVPLFIDGGLLYSRKDLLRESGYPHPPRTWEELIRMVRKILARENDPALQGFVWQGKQYEGLICNFLEFMSDRAQPLVTGPSAPGLNFDQPAVRTALSFMADLVYRRSVSPESVFSMSEEESRQVFQNGKAVFMRNWPYAWRLAQQAGSPVAEKIWVSPLPAWDEGGKSRAALGGFLLGIHRDTPYPRAARAWVRFLTGRRAQKILWEKLGLTPARRSVFPELTANGFPMDVLEDVMEGTVARPVTPVYIPISQSMQAYISGALAGVYSIDRSVRLVESDARRIFRILNG